MDKTGLFYTLTRLCSFITVTIYFTHAPGTSQITDFHCLDITPLTLISCPDLTCICQCQNCNTISECLFVKIHYPLSHLSSYTIISLPAKLSCLSLHVCMLAQDGYLNLFTFFCQLHSALSYTTLGTKFFLYLTLYESSKKKSFVST